VSFAKRVGGVDEPFGQTQTFEVVALGLQTLKDPDAAELLTFEKKTARLQRAVLGAIEAAKEGEERIKHIKKAVDDTPEADPKLGAEARRIEKGLGDVLMALRGDETMRSRNEPVAMSTVERVEAIVASQWRATVAPTGTSRQAYTIAADAFEGELATLRTLLDTDLRALDASLEKAGAPWTPGRVPVWSKE
jgi:hypothetical protein